MQPVRFSIVGIGGYASAYAAALDQLEAEGLAVTHSVVTRNPANYPDKVKDYRQRGVPVRASLEEMLERDAQDIDVVGIPCGINQHRRMVIASAEARCHVFEEKPPAATVQDTDAMIQALDRNGRWCQVGFQNQSSARIRKLKRLICDGKLGRIRSVAVKAMKSSGAARFTNPAKPWYGKFKTADMYILDGTVNNPYAHYLMNALYFASTEWRALSQPVTVRGEMYKGHHISSEDTSAIEVACANGATVHFFATLCPEDSLRPEIEVIGEKGSFHLKIGDAVTVNYTDGSSETVPPEEESPNLAQFRNAARYLRGLDAELNCPLQMTRPFTVAVNGAFESSGGTHKIPDETLKSRTDDNGIRHVVIPGINALINQAFAERKLFSDLGASWAVATQPFPVENYTRFDMPDQT